MIRRLVSGLVVLPRALFVDLWKVLLEFLRWLWGLLTRLWRTFVNKPSLFDLKKRRRYTDCVPMSHPAFKVPDPLIYAQYYLMELGLAVTWDNPDIVLRKNGVDVPSSALEPDTDYEIVARIWNNSLEAPVVDLPVSFSYLSFGVGTKSIPITAPGHPVLVTLGVKGGPNHPAFAIAKWHTPPDPGHYCIQVRLDPVSDANYGNNLGQENAQVGIAASPAVFAFLIRNNTTKQDTIHFEVDAYALPELPPCGRTGKAAFDPRTHATALYPVPPGWLVDIHPNNPVLQPQQEQAIGVTITPPQGFKGIKAFNINAFGLSNFLGGVTLYTTVN